VASPALDAAVPGVGTGQLTKWRMTTEWPLWLNAAYAVLR